MPLHDYRCPAGHQFERFTALPDLALPVHCECGAAAERVFLKFPFSTVQPDICYDSPIDGRPITSKQKRIEDLARSGCIPYDPEMKNEYLRRTARETQELEARVEETVEREIAQMPAHKRERLAAEMEAGLTAVPERSTADIAPVKERISYG